jgi:hypothetical protein
VPLEIYELVLNAWELVRSPEVLGPVGARSATARVGMMAGCRVAAAARPPPGGHGSATPSGRSASRYSTQDDARVVLACVGGSGRGPDYAKNVRIATKANHLGSVDF